MTNVADDFDALFDEVSAQRTVVVPPVPPVAAAVAPVAPAVAPAAAEDDFEVLFDQLAAVRVVPVAVAVPVAALAIAPVHADALASATDAEADDVASGKQMFERLGGIVRLLHDSLRELGYDKALTEAASQIVDAQDRLEYVASLTEQAANKVLNTLDQCMPAQDVLMKSAKDMDLRWAALFDGKLSIEEFKLLAGDSRQFAQVVAAASEAEKARLLEIMMAQDFQDLTGQLIKKVVLITKTVELELANLLRDHAPVEVRDKLIYVAVPPVHGASFALTHGPSAPSVALAQSNVDDLLADLGF
jgi:chemotaxis protein CheZ